MLPCYLVPDLLPYILDYPSCQALWILFADRRPCPFTWVLICLALNIPVLPFVRPCLFWPCLLIKACTWIHTPLVLSAPSSSISCGYWPGTDTVRLLLTLEQGLRSLDDYVQEYLEIAYYSDLPDCVLIDFFCEGINQPLKSRLNLEGPRSSLSDFMDYALLTVGPIALYIGLPLLSSPLDIVRQSKTTPVYI